ncbi:aminotransferase class III-fold pyridoxal phosphate-dependent enzyme [Nocardioides sp. QY071]|uniref:aspartate aminotransferase family protein n=1 Tax=Nocardioides sp. QY071 TaxID=3044187 RepID=UPI00249CC0A4|nr:aminotransferase class III-fold pyridoxal phosphate-dependent enzyme [Nocardioides sp. QY071]WGY00372.1 aminotransferase class III-fold pyridoxal phosphate-dependent enzyme [Nocardioides sp. QY071]
MSTGTTTTALQSALADAEERFGAANPRSHAAYIDAGRALPGGNTRTSLYYSPFPLAFASASAQHLTDLDGHVLTDFLGEYSAGLYGHSHPAIMRAARGALDAGIAYGGPNEHEGEFATLLAARFPSVDLLRFVNSGTEANLMAIATARAVTGRSHVLVFSGGYHGGVLSFRGASPVNVPFPAVVGTFNDVEGTRALIHRHRGELAAVIVEPMLGGAGAIPGSTAFLHLLQEASREVGAVFILDEVMTSRLAPGGLQEVHGLQPDLTTFGKYLGAGFSFGAFGGSRELMERYDPARPGGLSHPGTFNNNTLTMAAGAAGLREVWTPEVAVAHNIAGDRLRERTNAVFAEAGVAMQATGIGSIIALHFQSTPITAVEDVVPAEAQRALLHLEMILHGCYFARRGYLALSVALQPADHDAFLAALRAVVERHRAILS